MCSCTTMVQHKIISPTDHMYYDGTSYFENKDFDAAIKKYSGFIEKKPNSDLAIPAKLNLGMSYYYIEDYQNAQTTLSSINIKDENIKAFIGKIIEICKNKAPALTKETTTPALAKTKIIGKINITIDNAYLDRIGNLTIEGSTDKPSEVIINKIKTTTKENNLFSASVSWKKGRPVKIIANNNDGYIGELSYFPDSEPPKEPKGLQVRNLSSNSVEIEWDNNNEEDLKGYILYYRLKGGSLQEVRDIITNTDYEIVGLQALVIGSNKTFQFYVKAIDNMNNKSDDSDILEVILP